MSDLPPDPPPSKRWEISVDKRDLLGGGGLVLMIAGACLYGPALGLVVIGGAAVALAWWLSAR